MEIAVAVQRLRSRVIDDGLREAITRFAERCGLESTLKPGIADLPPDQAITQLQRMIVSLTQAYSQLVEMLGMHLRRELDRRYLVGELPEEARLAGGQR